MGSVFRVTTKGWLPKLWSLFGSLLQYGTYYLGYTKRELNFDNYPNIGPQISFALSCQVLASEFV